MADSGQPVLRKKQQAKVKAKHKNNYYSQKHVRSMEKIFDNNIKLNGEENDDRTKRWNLHIHTERKQTISKKK